MFSGAGATWHLVRSSEAVPVRPRARFSANDNRAVRHCAERGLGIALLPDFQARPLVAQNQMKAVLPGWGHAPVPVHAVFASSRYLSSKVRTLIDLAGREFGAVLNAVQQVGPNCGLRLASVAVGLGGWRAWCHLNRNPYSRDRTGRSCI